MKLADFSGLLHYLRQNPNTNLDFGVRQTKRPHLRINWMKTAGGWQWSIRPMSFGMIGGSGFYSLDEAELFEYANRELVRVCKPLPFKTPIPRPAPEWYLSTDKTQQVDESSIFAYCLGSTLTISLENTK